MSKAEGSLKRLGTDYIDLYLLHEPDQGTPSKDDDVGSGALLSRRSRLGRK